MAFGISKSLWFVTCLLVNLAIGGREPRIPCESDDDCNVDRTGLRCLDLDGPQECQCDPGTIWVPESEMCLNRGGVLCDYINFQPDNATCASGHCVTKCRASTNTRKMNRGIVVTGAEGHNNEHMLLCMDVCSKYIGENVESGVGLPFNNIRLKCFIFFSAIQIYAFSFEMNCLNL